MKSPARSHIAIVFIFGLLVRIVLIHLHPIIFGGDTVLRLANRDQILLSYQLPLLQAIVYSISKLADSLLPIRYGMAAIGAMAGAGFYLLATLFVERKSAFLAALLLSSSPFLIQLSIVPYQEVLMLCALLFAFYFFLAGHIGLASLSLGVACFTRYEAWIASAVMLIAYTASRGWRWKAILSGAALFGWAPLVWMAAHHGLSPGGTFVIEPPTSAARLWRYIYLGWITAKNTPLPVITLAGIGIWRLVRSGEWNKPSFRLLAAFLLLFLLAILASAHGESPDPERFVTSREATLLIAALVFLASFGIGVAGRLAVALSGAGIVLGIILADRSLVRDTSQPRIQLAYLLAQYLDQNMGESDKAVLLVPLLPKPLTNGYIDRVRRATGSDALHRAREILTSMDTSPPEYQRTVIHSRIGKPRLMNIAANALGDLPPEPDLTAVRWIALWSGFEPSTPIETKLLDLVTSRKPRDILAAGSETVSIYHGITRLK
jgi:hypothetical protein